MNTEPAPAAVLHSDVVSRKEFFRLVTDSCNAGFISTNFALTLAQTTTSPRLRLDPDLRTAAGLRDAESRLRDAARPATETRYRGGNWQIERLLDIHENRHEL